MKHFAHHLVGRRRIHDVHGPLFRLTEQRGRRLDWPERYPLATPPDWSLVTLHPSAVLRSDDRAAAYDGLVADLREAASLA